MAADEKALFSELVTQAFSAEQEVAQTLWVPLARQFARTDSDGAKEYLVAERQQLVDRVKKLLDQVKERIDG